MRERKLVRVSELYDLFSSDLSFVCLLLVRIWMVALGVMELPRSTCHPLTFSLATTPAEPNRAKCIVFHNRKNFKTQLKTRRKRDEARLPGVFAMYLVSSCVVNVNGVHLKCIVIDHFYVDIFRLVASQIERQTQLFACVRLIDKCTVVC